MDVDAVTVVLYLFFLGAGVIIYFIPAFIASRRRHKNATAILALNFFLGWMLVGWVAALVWALVAGQETRRRGSYDRREPTPFDEPPDPPPAPQFQPMLVYGCPHCRKPVHIAPALLGHVVACGFCGRQFTAAPTAPPAS